MAQIIMDHDVSGYFGTSLAPIRLSNVDFYGPCFEKSSGRSLNGSPKQTKVGTGLKHWVFDKAVPAFDQRFR